MTAPCSQCDSGFGCLDHALPSTHPPPQAALSPSLAPGSGATVQDKLDRLKSSGFIVYQPSNPVTLSKPLSDHSRSEIKTLAQKHAPTAIGDCTDLSAANNSGCSPSSKRKPEADVAQPNPPASASKRQRTVNPPSNIDPPTLPPTIEATVPANATPTSSLRYHASDCWYFVRGCASEQAPDDVSREDLLSKDAQYQASKPFNRFCRPVSSESLRVRCIPCMRDKGVWKSWANSKGGSTKRLRQHLKKYHGEEYEAKCREVDWCVPGQDTSHLDEEMASVKFTFEVLAEYMARFVAVGDQAINVVELREFRELLVLCSKATNLQDEDIPHRTKITTTTEELYLAEKARVIKELQNAQGRISITSDLWSDDVLRAFMAVTTHYIDSEGNLAEHLLAFRRIEGRHTGVNIANELFSILADAGITHKIGHVTLDNASNNNTLMAELESAFAAQEQQFGRELNRIRCLSHIVNLTVRAVIDALPAAARYFREEIAIQGDQVDSETEAYLCALESEPVNICRESVKAMRSSDSRREGLRETIRDGNFRGIFKTGDNRVITLPLLELLRDCETRWSSTHNMIARYLQLYPAVAQYAHHNPRMGIPVVSHKQYEVLQDICSVLSILHHAQQIVSFERTPTAALVLPVYEALIQALKDCTFKFPELQYAINCGVRKLESYVSITRDLPVYALAMVVNPALKFNWMGKHWTEARKQATRVLVKERMLDVRQKQHRQSATATPPRSNADRAAQAQSRGYLRLLSLSSSITRASQAMPGTSTDSNTDSHVPAVSPPSPRDLLLRHMAEVDAELLRWEQFEWTGIDAMSTINLVEFWKAHKHQFPLLYRIAMDILPVQASSVSSERTFSSSKMTCTRERNNISAEHMEQLQVLKHSLHRRRATSDNNQTLDFISHIAGLDSESESDSDSDD